ncbi:MFS transporter [Phenylobacterium sp. 20VBR1]|uniref:MFS transporter n=2 Tax=Phenylobacterium glaciei TaxID=2803784 RepID=A0A941HYL3_9CAUL|nr:MFS transporter [Phenylobacterium glaciei]
MTQVIPEAQTGRQLSLPTKLFYGFGSVAFGVKDNGFSYFLLIFYNQVMGLPAETVGLAIMVALFVDAFLDPIVGQASDNFRSKWGRRHPFMYAAAIPVAVSYLLLWSPPKSLDHQGLFFYLIGTAILIRSFITCYEIPSSALAAELTTGYDERTKLLSYRFLFGWIGGLVMYFAALKVFLTPDAAHKVGQLNVEGYAHYGVAAALLMLGAILISAVGTHGQIPFLREAPHRKLNLPTLAREMVGTLSHRSFLRILVANLFGAMAGGLTLSISLYFTTFFWEFSSAQIALFTFASLTAALFAFAAAPMFSQKFGKKRSAMTLLLIGVAVGCTPIVLRLMGLFPENGSALLFPIIFLQNVVSTGATITANILTSSMIADVVEDSELKTGRRSEGLFFAASAFVAKAVTGIGIFTSAMLLKAAAFPQGAKPGEVDPAVIARLGMIYVPVLIVLYGLCVTFMSGYRITRESHAESLRQLAAAADLVNEGEPASQTGKLS